MNKAIGLVEVIGLASAINISDAMLKVASVELIGLEKTKGMGWIVVKVAGGVGAVTASVDAGVAKAKEDESLVAYKVIPRPGSGLEPLMVGTDVFQKEEEKESARTKPDQGSGTDEAASSEKTTSKEAITEPEIDPTPAPVSGDKEAEKKNKDKEKEEAKKLSTKNSVKKESKKENKLEKEDSSDSSKKSESTKKKEAKHSKAKKDPVR